MNDLYMASVKALRILDWLERRSIYQDHEIKETHQELKKAIKEYEKSQDNRTT